MPAKTYPVALIGSELTIGPFPVSYETGEVLTANKLAALPYRCVLKAIHTTVAKAIAGSNDGTLTVKKSSTTLGSVTHTASDALDVERDSSNVDSTVPIEVTDQITITSAKSTAGGRVLCTLTVEVLPSH